MAGWLKRAWHDPVGSKVISSGILALLAATGIFTWWENVLVFLGQVWRFLGNTTALPNWLIGILFLIAAGALAMLAIAVIANRSPEAQAPNEFSYRSDIIFGVKWRWEYYHHSINKPSPFCPFCDCQIIPTEGSYFSAVPKITLRCEDCRSFERSFDGSFEELQVRTVLQVQKNLRNGNWRAAVATGQQT